MVESDSVFERGLARTGIISDLTAIDCLLARESGRVEYDMVSFYSDSAANLPAVVESDIRGYRTESSSDPVFECTSSSIYMQV